MIFYVYKEEWCQYSENRGKIVIADTWQQAKGIAIAEWGKNWVDKKNVKVEELDLNLILNSRGVLCASNSIEHQYVIKEED